MLYEPVKDRLSRLAGKSRLLRRLFYWMLNLVFLRNWYVRSALRRIVKQYPADSTIRVLDAGTGLGLHAYFLARTFSNVRVHAVDLNEEYLRYARSFISSSPIAGRVTFGIEDLTLLRSDGPFDLILSVDVMEHIEDDRAVFRHFHRVLNPGGVAVINTPSDQGGSDVRDRTEESFIGEHVRDGYRREELVAKLEAAGLQVDQTRFTYGAYGSAAWSLLVKYPIKLISVSWLLAILLIPYYLLALPIGLVLNAVDFVTTNRVGTGILVVARKPPDAVVTQ